MRRQLMKLAGLAAAGLLALTAAQTTAHAAPAKAAADKAYFVFQDITREQFTIELTDPAKIEHARELVSGETSDRPHVIGRIVKRTAYYNPRWSYHLNPDTIDFFDQAIEVCDSTIPYTEEHLDEAGGPFLPGLVWCPWTSRLVREVPRP
ncbi:calmodulin-binding protein [Streptomyces yokosukanensis]|uniref:Calmodulin-binding protein n=1 Tax=Streptomyces yokosukanensis TaxID=67386 RepID=A0A101P927_9ACTN|nr:calmodulin-binding protein [Streptomyces yokosukanensis]KUN07155.1 calmodulin-binding protein [Streptomyces yokosukanensis]